MSGDSLFLVAVRALGVCVLAVTSVVVVTLVFIDLSAVRVDEPPSVPGNALLSVNGASPLAPFGVLAGDIVERVEHQGDTLTIHLIRDEERHIVTVHGADTLSNPFVKALRPQ